MLQTTLQSTSSLPCTTAIEATLVKPWELDPVWVLTSAHSAVFVVNAGCYTDPELLSMPMVPRPRSPLQGYAPHDRQSLEPYRHQQH